MVQFRQTQILAVACLFACRGMSGQTPVQVSVPGVIDLAKSWVLTLSLLSESQDSLAQIDALAAKKSGLEGVMDQMTGNRRIVKTLERCESLVPAAAKFPADSTERMVVSAFRAAIGNLKLGMDQHFLILQGIVDLKDAKQLSRLMASAAQLAANMDEEWKTIVKSTAALTYSFIDMNRVTNGTLQHLRLKSAERQSLVAEIDRLFPRLPTELIAGQTFSLSAAVALKQVLTGPHKSADEK